MFSYKNGMNLNTVVEDFNKYFSGVADTIHKHIKNNCINPNPKTKSNNYDLYVNGFRESIPKYTNQKNYL